eukprot:gene6590-14877_t
MRAAIFAALVAPAAATQYTWRGIIDNQWTTANNWSPTGVPGDNAADAVTIDDAENKDTEVQLTQAKTVAVLNLGDKLAYKAKLTLLAGLTVTSSLSIQHNGALKLYSGAGIATAPASGTDVKGRIEAVGTGGLAGGDWKVNELDSSGCTLTIDGCAVDVTTATTTDASCSFFFKNGGTLSATKLNMTSQQAFFQPAPAEQAVRRL